MSNLLFSSCLRISGGFRFFFIFYDTIEALVGGVYPSPGKLLRNMPVLAPPIHGDSASWDVAQNDIPIGKLSKEGPGTQGLWV